MPIAITSCGELHAPPPPAELTLNLRRNFRDPHFTPELTQLTARHAAVRDTVERTPGIRDLIEAAAQTVLAYIAGPVQDVRVTTICGGGRHRAPHVAELLADRLRAYGQTVTVHHRDIDRPVVHREPEKTGVAG